MYFALAVLFYSPLSPYLLVQSLIRFFPPYYFFLPTIVSDFVSYALCRLDDWSWGNKEVMLTTAQIKVLCTSEMLRHSGQQYVFVWSFHYCRLRLVQSSRSGRG